MIDCPPPGTLEQLVGEELVGPVLARVVEHVEHCDCCQKVLDQLGRDEQRSVVRLLRPEECDQDLDSAAERFIAVLSDLGPARLPVNQEPDDTAELTSSNHEDLPKVDGYKVLCELGRGGMGIVYKALHIELNRLVALKMLLAGPQLAPHARERFRHEASSVARLCHPNIVQVYDFGEQNRRLYFSMELVAGGSLAGQLGGAPLAPRRAAQLVATLALAVEYAHQNGVVHRDLKPANILVDSDGPGRPGFAKTAELPGEQGPLPSVKITDFGLAKEIASLDDALTQTGAVLGTPSYMAPEQARGRGEPIGPAADVYALGAILYELLTGRPPFRASSSFDTLMQVVHMIPVSILRLVPRVPVDLVTICMKCLEKDPRRRYPTADDLAGDLSRFLNHEPIRARRVGVAGHLTRWSRRNPAVAGMIATLALVTALAFVAVVSQWREAVLARDRARALAYAESAALAEAARAGRDAERTNVRLIVDRGLAQCERGEVGAGLLWLARGLEEAESVGPTLRGVAVPSNVDLGRPIRTNLAAWAGRLLVPRVSPGLGASVAAVAFSPDGRRVLSGAWDGKWGNTAPGEVQLWSLDGWKPVGSAFRHPGPVVAVAFNPDGRRALTGCADGSVRLWDLSTGTLAAAPASLAVRLNALALSPDGTWYVSGGCSERGGEARRWHPATGKPLGPPLLHPGPVESVAVSPDGKAIITGCSVVNEHGAVVGGEARLWNAATGEPMGRPLMHADAVKSVAFSPDGRTLLTGCDDAMARLWDRETGQHVGRPQPHAFPVLATAFSADGKAVISGGGRTRRLGADAGELRLWDVTTGKVLVGALTLDTLIHSVAFRPDGRWVVAGCRDGRMRAWNVDGVRPLQEWTRAVPVATLAFSPDGKLLLTGGGPDSRKLSGSSDMEAFSESRRMFGNAPPDRGLAWLNDASTGRTIGLPLEHSGPVESVAFSPDGLTVATGTRDGWIRLWDTAGRPLCPPREQSGNVRCIVFRPDGRALATCGDHGPARVWEVPSGRLLGQPLAHGTAVRSLAFSPDGRTIATAGHDGMVRLWDATTLQRLGAPMDDGHEVTVVAFSPDGRTVLVGAKDFGARRWNTATGRLLGAPVPHDGVVWSVSFSRDGGRFLTVTGTPNRDWGFVRLWDAASARPFGPPLPQRVSVTAAAFHPSGRLVATGGWAGDVRVWDVASSLPVGPALTQPGSVLALAFDPSGRRLASVGEDGTCRVWIVPEPVVAGPYGVRQWVQSITGQALDGDGAILSLGDPQRRPAS
jgi:eukaryotic-like serine/threonine-protein kinase